MTHPPRSVVVVIAAAAALSLAAAGRAQDPPPEQPVPASLPADVVAQVSDQRAIRRARFDHWFAIARKSDDRRSSKRRLVAAAMTFLIEGTWMRLEARERGLKVRRFLRDSGQTTADMLYRMETDMLSDRIRADVIKGARTVEGQIRRLDRFAAEFPVKWKARTVCATGYTVDECGRTVAGAPAP
jgi:hypothetical protein